MKKKDRAVEIARQILKDNPDIDNTLLRTKVKEGVPCARTCAYEAVNIAREDLREHKAAEEPKIEAIKSMPSAEPATIEPVMLRELEEVEPIETIEKPPEMGEPEFIRNMSRWTHELFMSTEGLPEKYGITPKEARTLGDGLYEVLKDRIGIEKLREYGVWMLAAGYFGAFGKMGVKIWRERRKQKTKEKNKPKPS